MTIAVDVSTKPMPATKATSGAKPASTPAMVSSAPQTQHLRGAQPEDLAPQVPQPRRPHLQPDHEQEHHDAELGDMQDRLRVGEQARARTAR